MAQKRKDEPADTLEEIESIGERLAQWVGANPIAVLAIAAVILIAAAGYGGYRAYAHAQGNKASTSLATLHSDFVAAMGGKPTDVEIPEPANPETAKAVRMEYAEKYVAVAAEWKDTATGSLALLEAGQIYSKLGNDDRALEVFREALDQAPAASPIRGVIASRVAHLYEQKGDFEAAANAHEEAAAVPGFPLHTDALAAAARCWAEAGKPEQALAIYQRLKAATPELRLAPHVEARLQELEARSVAAPPAAKAPEATPTAAAAPPDAAPVAKP